MGRLLKYAYIYIFINKSSKQKISDVILHFASQIEHYLLEIWLHKNIINSVTSKRLEMLFVCFIHS